MTPITQTTEHYLNIIPEIRNYLSGADSDPSLLFGEISTHSRFNETPLIGNQTPSITKNFTTDSPDLSETLKILFNRSKTFMPLFVAGKIVAMCGYKLYKRSGNQKKLDKILNQNDGLSLLVQKRTALLESRKQVLDFYKSGLTGELALAKPARNQIAIKYMLGEIGKLKREIRKLESDKAKFQKILESNAVELPKVKTALQSTWISLAELFALGFSHPGSNVWKSCTDLSGRVCSLFNRLNSASKQPLFNKDCVKDSLANIGSIAMMATAIAGTLLSVLKHAGVIDGKDPLSERVLALSFAVQILETGIMMKNYIHVKINSSVQKTA
jgi:hypothetical protein